MKAIIPTAGIGKRLQPFTLTLPKVLLQVAGKPILGHIVDKLLHSGIEEITFVVGYLGDRVEAYVTREHPQVKARFVEQTEPRGLGHAIHVAAPHHRNSGEPILIVLGDTIIDVDLDIMLKAETDMIGVREVQDPRRFGVVEMDGEYIKAMVEKPENPPSNLAIVGIYSYVNSSLLFDCLEANIEKGILTKGEVQLTDALQGMLDKGARMKTFKVDGWHDCGTFQTFLSTNRELLEKNQAASDIEIQGRYPTSRILQPVHIAPTAEIEDSVVGPNVSIADGVKIKRSVISDSIVNEGATLEDAVLDASIIGNHAIVRGKPLELKLGDKSEIH